MKMTDINRKNKDYMNIMLVNLKFRWSKQFIGKTELIKIDSKKNRKP